MATFTTNYNLRKPATTDFITVATDLNANYDIIDSEIKLREDEITALEARPLTRMSRVETDQSVASSTAFVDATNLSFTVTAGKTYIYEFVIRYTASTLADLKYELTFPGAGLMINTTFGLGAAAGASTDSFVAIAGSTSSSPTGTRVVGGAGGTGVGMRVKGSFVCDTTGTVQFRFAQDTSNATATIISAGSYVLSTEF